MFSLASARCWINLSHNVIAVVTTHSRNCEHQVVKSVQPNHFNLEFMSHESSAIADANCICSLASKLVSLCIVERKKQVSWSEQRGKKGELMKSRFANDRRAEKVEWRYSRHASSLPNEKGIIPMKCVKPVNYSLLHELLWKPDSTPSLSICHSSVWKVLFRNSKLAPLFSDDGDSWWRQRRRRLSMEMKNWNLLANKFRNGKRCLNNYSFEKPEHSASPFYLPFVSVEALLCFFDSHPACLPLSRSLFVPNAKENTSLARFRESSAVKLLRSTKRFEGFLKILNTFEERISI